MPQTRLSCLYDAFMKKTYHLCLSAGDEVLFRAVDEYNQFISDAFSEEYPGRIILSKKIVSEMMSLEKKRKIPFIIV